MSEQPAAPTKAPVDPHEDIAGYILPNFGNCGAGVAEIGPAITRAIEFLTTINGDVTGTTEWKHEWIPFWEDPVLVALYCCLPCCVAARTAEKTVGGTYEGRCLAGYASGCVCLGPCYAASIRTDFRKKYDLKGSTAEDCILTCCLGCFTLCQQAREGGVRGGYVVPFTTVGAPPKAPAAAAATAPVAQEASREPALQATLETPAGEAPKGTAEETRK